MPRHDNLAISGTVLSRRAALRGVAAFGVAPAWVGATSWTGAPLRVGIVAGLAVEPAEITAHVRKLFGRPTTLVDFPSWGALRDHAVAHHTIEAAVLPVEAGWPAGIALRPLPVQDAVLIFRRRCPPANTGCFISNKAKGDWPLRPREEKVADRPDEGTSADPLIPALRTFSPEGRRGTRRGSRPVRPVVGGAIGTDLGLTIGVALRHPGLDAAVLAGVGRDATIVALAPGTLLDNVAAGLLDGALIAGGAAGLARAAARRAGLLALDPGPSVAAALVPRLALVAAGGDAFAQA